ncbi:cadherin-related family member 5-like isoform X1 [Rhinatrema bivittatum]|uniref:cadherin-related family member 5-like isoform X1 n=1 Tax=Rhinatrema bivittatum TaxID=194408 RepID=UPI00112E42BF|nr:cadherin-related family member 5-like isoform X1 [Rhinatrema bivittatum]
MEHKTSSKPLQIVAIDDDFPDKLNPAITYKVENSSVFRISRDGFLLTNAVLSSAITITALVKAVDEKSTQEATTLVSVEVTPSTIDPVTSTTVATTKEAPGSLSSTLPPGPLTKTTRNPSDMTTMTSGTNNNVTGATLKPIGTTQTTSNTGKPATGIPSDSFVTTARVPLPSVSSITTAKPAGTTGSTRSTGKPATGIPSGSLVTTSHIPPPPVASFSTAKPLGSTSVTSGLPDPGLTNPLVTGAGFTTSKTGGLGEPTTEYTTSKGPQTEKQFSSWDMANVGAPLAAGLFICLVIVVFLLYKLYGNPKEKKSASDGTDSISGNMKEKGNYGTNDGIADPTDTENEIAAVNLAFEDEELSAKEQGLNGPSSTELEEEKGLGAALSHQEADEELDTDSEKNTKSILTKERRMDEGYKAVWFKEDIEPDTKTEEEEGEEDDEGAREDEEEEDASNEGDRAETLESYHHDPIVNFSIEHVTGTTDSNEDSTFI